MINLILGDCLAERKEVTKCTQLIVITIDTARKTM